MKSNDKDARERIIEVTLNILDEVDDIEKVTVRQIAERANVGVGLINYHFKTKDNLLSIAIGDVMSNVIAELNDDSVYTLRPIEDLKSLLKKLCEIGLLYSGINIKNKHQRDSFIDILIENIIRGNGDVK